MSTAGATVHWHGYPVANAFDGVAGVTQDACGPGEEFHADIAMTQPGTYWYHTHQRGSEGVVRGLYGTLVVEPESGPTEDVDITLPVHTLSGQIVLGTSDVLEERVVAPGDSVRLRLINTDQTPHTFAVQGAPFRVVAIDGTDVASALLDERSLVIPAGGRLDVVLEMPDTPVRVGVAAARERGYGARAPRGRRHPGTDRATDRVRSLGRPRRSRFGGGGAAFRRRDRDLTRHSTAGTSMSSARSCSTGFRASCRACRTTATPSTAVCTRTSIRRSSTSATP